MDKVTQHFGDSFKEIKSRDGKITGKLLGGTRRCTMEGCRGERFAVRWPNGQLTWPCSGGIGFDSKGLVIK